MLSPRRPRYCSVQACCRLSGLAHVPYSLSPRKLLAVGLERRDRQVGGEIVDPGIAEHEGILDEESCARRCPSTAWLCMVCGTQSALVSCLSASGWVYSTTGIASTSTGVGDIGDPDVADLAALAHRDEDRGLGADAVELGDDAGVAQTDVALVQVVRIERRNEDRRKDAVCRAPFV